MKRATYILATVATMAAATTATAEQHEIIILQDAYFPQVTYLDSGDTVRFINLSGATHNIIAKNGSWEIGPIASEGEYVMTMTQGTQNTFYNKDATSEEDGSFLIEGRMSFSEAPLD